MAKTRVYIRRVQREPPGTDRTVEVILPSCYVNKQTPTIVSGEREYAIINVRPRGREAARTHRI